LSLPPSLDRDDHLSVALKVEGTLLEDEPYADWALRPREALDALRQEARLTLARDRAAGLGRSGYDDLVASWEACFNAEPTSQEAATALVQAHLGRGHQTLAGAVFRRCRESLEALGLPVSPALERALMSGSNAKQLGGPRQPARTREERRLVSVLFADLVGPVEADEFHGPEDLGELIGAALAEIVSNVEALGGTVSAVSGTGVVALFGAPENHEDDPERALRAALRCVSNLNNQGGQLSLRVGVETGEAVVGPLGGSSSTHYGAVGEAVSIAAALNSAAMPASVLVGPATRRAAEALFEWGGTEEVAAHPAAKPLAASYLLRPKVRAKGDVSRRRLAGSAPLVGRSDEVSVLRTALQDATEGKGSVLVLVGEPGLGKTRLVEECRKLFISWVGSSKVRLPLWLEGRAASFASNRPYGLYHQLLSAWVGVGPEESDNATRLALERALKAVYGARADTGQVRLLAHVMGLGPESTGPLLEHFGPEQLQLASFSAVRDLLARLMGHGPTLLVLEDMHWADPTSLRLTEAISSLTADGPLLLLLTRRPEPDPGTSRLEAALLGKGWPRRRKLELAPLTEGPERDLASALLGEAPSDEVVNAVSKGVEGNPLFLEERVTSLLETGALRKGDDGQWRIDLGAPGQVPEVLERLVRSRVDRLEPNCRAAVVAASVLGPEFSLGGLSTVTDLGAGLAPSIQALCSANLLIELRKLPEPTYRFRHSLIQDAIYRGLLRHQRRHLHALAAFGLEAASTTPTDIAGLLGRHYTIAGQAERAGHYLELAGDAAAAAYANDEAITSYRSALDVLGEEPELVTEAIGLWLKLGSLLWRFGRYDEGRTALYEAAHRVPPEGAVLAAQCYRLLGQLEIEDCHDRDAFTALDKAEQILQSCKNKESDNWVENWLALQLSRSNLHYWRDEGDLQAAVLERARPLVETQAGSWQNADFRVHMAGQRWRRNRFAIDESALADVKAARALVSRAGLNQEEFHWHTLGFLLVLHGDLEEAVAELEGALAAARRAGDKSLELANLVFLGWARLRQHDVPAVKEVTLLADELVRARAFPSAGMVKALQSWVAWKEERDRKAESLALEALEQWRPTVVRYPFCSICLWPLIAVRIADGRSDEAVTAVQELVRPPQMRLPYELEVSVQSAISAWESADRPETRECLQKTLALAEKLGHL
jgi:class 3 adenylate cyclase/tetratricopeptide (TPR) repeat protein